MTHALDAQDTPKDCEEANPDSGLVKKDRGTRLCARATRRISSASVSSNQKRTSAAGVLAKKLRYRASGAVSTVSLEVRRARKNGGRACSWPWDARDCNVDSSCGYNKHSIDFIGVISAHRCGRERFDSGDPAIFRDLPRWFRDKSGEREPVVELVLLEVRKRDQ